MSGTSQRSARPAWLGVDKRTWDHMRVHSQVLLDNRLGAYEQSVYLGLAWHADATSSKCFPSAATLAAYGNVSEKTVRRSLKVLVDCGYVSLHREKGKAHTYKLLPPPTLDSQSTLSDTDPGLTVQGPWTHSPRTLDSGADEQEPITRTNNKRKFVNDGVARLPEPRESCEACDAGWIVQADGTVLECGQCLG